MTRSTTVNQETQMVEMEEQITVLQGSARRDEEKSREEINQNADESRNAILDELRSIFGATIPDKGKEVVGESSEGVGETPMAAGNLLYQLGAEVSCPAPRATAIHHWEILTALDLLLIPKVCLNSFPRFNWCLLMAKNLGMD